MNETFEFYNKEKEKIDFSYNIEIEPVLIKKQALGGNSQFNFTVKGDDASLEVFFSTMAGNMIKLFDKNQNDEGLFVIETMDRTKDGSVIRRSIKETFNRVAASYTYLDTETDEEVYETTDFVEDTDSIAQFSERSTIIEVGRSSIEEAELRRDLFLRDNSNIKISVPDIEVDSNKNEIKVICSGIYDILGNVFSKLDIDGYTGNFDFGEFAGFDLNINAPEFGTITLDDFTTQELYDATAFPKSSTFEFGGTSDLAKLIKFEIVNTDKEVTSLKLVLGARHPSFGVTPASISTETINDIKFIKGAFWSPDESQVTIEIYSDNSGQPGGLLKTLTVNLEETEVGGKTHSLPLNLYREDSLNPGEFILIDSITSSDLPAGFQETAVLKDIHSYDSDTILDDSDNYKQVEKRLYFPTSDYLLPKFDEQSTNYLQGKNGRKKVVFIDANELSLTKDNFYWIKIVPLTFRKYEMLGLATQHYTSSGSADRYYTENGEEVYYSCIVPTATTSMSFVTAKFEVNETQFSRMINKSFTGEHYKIAFDNNTYQDDVAGVNGVTRNLVAFKVIHENIKNTKESVGNMTLLKNVLGHSLDFLGAGSINNPATNFLQNLVINEQNQVELDLSATETENVPLSEITNSLAGLGYSGANANATVTEDGSLIFDNDEIDYESDNDKVLIIDNDNKIFNIDMTRHERICPVGIWAKILNVGIGNIDVSEFEKQKSVFIKASEYDFENERYSYTFDDSNYGWNIEKPYSDKDIDHSMFMLRQVYDPDRDGIVKMSDDTQKIDGVAVDTSSKADGYILEYSATLDKFVMVENQGGGLTEVDWTDITNVPSPVTNLTQTVIDNSHAPEVLGTKEINEATIYDRRLIIYDALSNKLRYEDYGNGGTVGDIDGGGMEEKYLNTNNADGGQFVDTYPVSDGIDGGLF
jgi:hypothetical protein